ncbi:glycoside hydrolase family protein [Paenibacillus roseipurpureus]|uniref:Uncharacterized protein n=1 Tax=Paenibacillus roseopurpureus TaxID=2918901 RepID=A0AA96LL01_9BACL|nr:hypothetical protein [Paenibacillus sp. MBLB1832]WNR42899.1 hypothetical protein MJB10_17465 [Paenibacillus sp. MBLB1832]
MTDVIFKVSSVHSTPVITDGKPGTEGNGYGFEGGRVLKLNGAYHLFTTEMSGLPIWTRTKLAYWRSKDSVHWERVSTLMESSGNFDGTDTHACLWSPMPTYDAINERWVLTYVCYRSKPNTRESWYRNYDGRIAMAVSQVKGPEGMAGPYEETGFLMEPGADSASWEGLMGVNSFYPYLTDSGWYAWYGSSIEVNGLAKAPELSGPWHRVSLREPASRHTENPIVSRLEDGRFVAFFDGCGHHQKMGYMVSSDGITWSEPILLEANDHPNRWWGLTRTPLGLVSEGNGKYALPFTAYNRNFYDIPGIWSAESDSVFDGYFASVGWMELELEKG